MTQKRWSALQRFRSASRAQRGRNYILVILTATYTLNLLDRGLIAVLLQPIKDELRLSDGQLGLLTGLVFGLFYAAAGIPLARWSDRGNRITVAAGSIGLWGLTMMGTMLVANFAQLALARMLAAIGEAGCKPPTYSLIGDFFPEPVERTRAMGIYWLGGPLSVILSFVLGGILNDLVGWRLTFLIMGIPGLLLAVLLRVGIKDPKVNRVGHAPSILPRPSITDVFRVMWNTHSLRHISIALVLFYTISYGLSPWYASFLIRTFSISVSEAGVYLGLVLSASGAFGILLGSYVSARWFAGDESGQLKISAASMVLLAPFVIFFLLSPKLYYSLIALIPLSIAFSFLLAPVYALMQRLVPDKMRATSLAVLMMFANLIGMGVGPQAVGLVSDALQPTFGTHSLKYAMTLASMAALLCAFHFWRGSQSIALDLKMQSAGSSASSRKASDAESI